MIGRKLKFVITWIWKSIYTFHALNNVRWSVLKGIRLSYIPKPEITT